MRQKKKKKEEEEEEEKKKKKEKNCKHYSRFFTNSPFRVKTLYFKRVS